MAENAEQSTGKDVAEGLKSIFQRIADFFDIFDLSFMVSGAVTLAALCFWGWRVQLPKPPLPEGWLFAVILIGASYVLGLLCFVLGRWLRVRWRSKRFNKRFVEILRAHGLDAVSPFSDYLARSEDDGNARLYVRLWAAVRDSPDIGATFSLLRRYWVMAATCDGMVVALIVWMAVVIGCMSGFDNAQQIDWYIGFIAIAVLAVSALACRYEAGRYVLYQMEQLVSAISAKRTKV